MVASAPFVTRRLVAVLLSVSISGPRGVLSKMIVTRIDDSARAGIGTRASSMWMLGSTNGRNGFGMSKPIGTTTSGRWSPATSASSRGWIPTRLPCSLAAVSRSASALASIRSAMEPSVVPSTESTPPDEMFTAAVTMPRSASRTQRGIWAAAAGPMHCPTIQSVSSAPT